MVDDHIILTAERLRDDLAEFKAALRKKYRTASRQVSGDDLRAQAAKLAETWLVDLAERQETAQALGSDYLADLTVRFQKLLTLSEHASKRSRYDAEIRAILQRFSLDAIIPLKKLLQESPSTARRSATKTAPNSFEASAFVGHSFSNPDKPVVTCVTDTLRSLGISVSTAEKPKADSISEKVKRLIEANFLFVGVFTRRDKLAQKREWTTSSWIIDEKAYAVGKRKKLILLKEQGVGSIGGIQGDYEFIEFDRESLHVLVKRILELFDLNVAGLRR